MTIASRIAAAVALCAVYVAWGATVGNAAPVPTWSQTCATGDVNYNLCLVESERLAYVAAELSSIDDNTASGGTSSVSLSSDDQARLDYMWWGVWFGVGLLAAVLVAIMVGRSSAIRWWSRA